ncbi:VCBS repeat-containing protein, partial [Tenacibaculum finnmarkense genomovar finnmarkense]|uniref:FG-GAP repeat domain-containing protein n=1 Tax=Tenacibaculum finnmarkense TaxID=2781243 RepID=UPI001E65C217
MKKQLFLYTRTFVVTLFLGGQSLFAGVVGATSIMRLPTKVINTNDTETGVNETTIDLSSELSIFRLDANASFGATAIKKGNPNSLYFKYGISMDETVANTYVTSDGTAIMWGASKHSGYDKNIIGVKRNSRDLNQVAAKSATNIESLALPPVIVPTSVTPAAFFVGNDGDDVFLGTPKNIEVAAWVSNNDGTFSPTKIVPNTFTIRNNEGTEMFGDDGYSQTFFKDADGDGYKDIVSVTENNNSIYVWLNNRDNTFDQSPKTTVSMESVGSGTFTGLSNAEQGWMADTNNDKKIDYIFSGNNNQVHTFLGNGDGTFNLSKISSTITDNNTGNTSGVDGGEDHFIGDVNNDGIADLVSTSNLKIQVYFGIGDGGFNSTADYNGVLYDSGSSNSVGSGEDRYSQLIDMDGDGVLDYMHAEALNGTAQILYFKGSGTGTFSTTAIITTIINLPQGEIGRFANSRNNEMSFFEDVTSDGIADFVATYDNLGDTKNGITVYIGKADGTFEDIAHTTVIPEFRTGTTGRLSTIVTCGLLGTNNAFSQIGKEADSPDVVNSVITTTLLSIIPGITDVVVANEEKYQNYIDGNPSEFSNPATLAEVQAMIDAVQVLVIIENYAENNANIAPTVANYISAGVIGVVPANLAEINAAIDAVEGIDVDTLSEVQAVVDKVLAIKIIEDYAESNTNSVPTEANYTAAGVIGVTSANLAEVNAAIDAVEGANVNTLLKIQVIVDKVLAVATVVTSSGSGTLTEAELTTAGVTNTGLSVAEIAAIQTAVAAASPAPTNTAALQLIVDAAVTETAAVLAAVTSAGNGTLTAVELTAAGVTNTGLSATEIAAIQTAVAAASPAPTDAAALQLIVDAAVTELAAETAAVLAAVTSAGNGTLTEAELTAAGVTNTGLSVAEIAAIQTAVAAASPAPTDAAALQLIVDAAVTELAAETAAVLAAVTSAGNGTL